jgi:threonylcarbamoyladenosine tRNA methylthiotransferase MtaB
VANFGCRASQSEGAAIEAELRADGRTRAGSALDADVVVVNSCTVTAEADRDVDRLLGKLARRNPDARIVVTGCYAQRAGETLASRPGVRYVVGNSHKDRVARLAADCLEDPVGRGRAEVFCSDVFSLAAPAHQGSLGRTRATLKVQDGCDASCTFCIIPEVRGRSRSLGAAGAIDAVRELVALGYREVVFSGIHLGSWGRDIGIPERLADLVSSTLDAVPALERLRLSSIEPLEVSKELLAVMASTPRVARHLHVPMQSGSSGILRAMRRPYDAEEYARRIRAVREALPEAAIGADVMVGFPGETDDDFHETERRIASLPLTYLHVFPYSARPGTVAASFGERVSDPVLRRRTRALLDLGEGKKAAFRRRFVGRRLPVLALDTGEGPDPGYRRGLSDNFLEVRLDRGLEPNRWHEVRVRGESAGRLDARTRGGSGLEDDDGGRDRVVVGERDLEPAGPERRGPFEGDAVEPKLRLARG